MTYNLELIGFCRSLVRIPSYSGSETRVAQAVKAQMEALDYDRVEVDSLGNVIGQVLGNEAGPTVMLDAHMDVVAVPDQAAWKHNPWGAELYDDKIWGRGAADTKGSLAAMVFAIGKISRADLRGKCVVVASVCEENLTSAAISPLIERFTPQVFVTGEPTQLRLGTAQKGRFALLVETRGQSVHTSHPELGSNAIYKMLDVLKRLRRLSMPEDPQLGRGVLELTEIRSEPHSAGAFVPNYCQARLMGRILPGESQQSALKQVEAALAGLPDLEFYLAPLEQTCYTGAVLHMDDFIPPWRNDPHDPWQKRILSKMGDLETFGAGFGTNASAAAAQGITSFIYGPGSLEQAHATDEWLDIEQLLKAVDGYASIAIACLGRQ